MYWYWSLSKAGIVFKSHGDDATSENSSDLNKSFECGQKKSSQDPMKDIESTESTRKRKEQDDTELDQKSDTESKGTIPRNAMDSKDAVGETKPSNGEKASEPSLPDAKLSKLTCATPEMTKSNLSLPINPTETCCTDVEMLSPESPTCKKMPINVDENVFVCFDSESKATILNPDDAVDSTKDIPEVTCMETDDTEPNSSAVMNESDCNQTQTSSLVRYSTVFSECFFIK